MTGFVNFQIPQSSDPNIQANGSYLLFGQNGDSQKPDRFKIGCDSDSTDNYVIVYIPGLQNSLDQGFPVFKGAEEAFIKEGGIDRIYVKGNCKISGGATAQYAEE